jgi:PAS domain S-box-containing protein
MTTTDLLDESDLGLVLYDSEGSIVECNDRAKELLGLVADLAGETSLEARVAGSMKRDGTPYALEDLPSMIALKEGRVTTKAVVGLDRYGQPMRWFNVTAVPVFEAGADRIVAAAYLDITPEIERERMLELLTAVNALVTSARDESDLLQGLCEVLVHKGGYSLAWIGVPSEEVAGMLEQPYAAGSTDYLFDGIVSFSEDEPRGRGPTGMAFRERKTQVANDLLTQERHETWRERALEFQLASAVAIPITTSREAVLTVYDRHVRGFDDVLTQGLEDVVHAVELEAALLRSVSSVERALEGTINALAGMTELRDPYTQGHQRRVGVLGAAIATHLGLDSELVELIRLSGTVHDVGKIAVPSEILTRPGRLTAVEYEMVKTHCQAGQDVLASAALPWPLADVALQHHERLDGSGYPQGLVGDEISLPARIVAVADVVEAMMNHRPYRPALGFEEAISVISAGRGTLFDPSVVDACVDVFELGFILKDRAQSDDALAEVQEAG